MAQEFTVSLQAIIDECKLEVIHTPQDPAKIFISNIDVNRPGLQLAGFFEFFDKDRIQIIGRNETTYLQESDEELRLERVKELISRKPPAVIITRGMEPLVEMTDLAMEYKVPILRTGDTTSAFMSSLISFLNV